MPHKHRRDKLKSDPSYWDLDPDKTLHPLPIAKASSAGPAFRKTDLKHTLRKSLSNSDIPRAFARLLQPYRPPRSGLDDGARPSKKRKLTTMTSSNNATSHTLNSHTLNTQDLKIQPHEPLSHFSARVDSALPFSTLAKAISHNDPSLKGIGKGRQTKTEKKMQKMQRQWREDDQRRKDRTMIDEDEGDGVVDEDGVEDMGVQGSENLTKRKGKRKSNEPGGEELWREVEIKRKYQEGEKGSRGLVGLHDIVQAPPKLGRAPTGELWTGAKVRKGGLKAQVELEEARQSVVDGYRTIMKKKRETTVGV